MKNLAAKTTGKNRALQTIRKGVVKTKGVMKSKGSVGAGGATKIESVSSKTRTFSSIVTTALKKGGFQKTRVRDLLATVGVGGHCVTALASDFTFRQLTTDHLQSELEREISDGVETRYCFKIIIEDDDGDTPLAAPVVRFKTLDDRVSKMLGEASLGAYRAPCLRVGHCAVSGASRMILSTRLIAMTESSASADDIGELLRSTKAASLLNAGRITVKAIEADGIHDATSWLLAVPPTTIRSCRTKNGLRWKPYDPLADHECK